MESDPKFRDLTYQEQVEARIKVVGSYWTKDSDYLALPPEVQRDLIEKVGYTKPLTNDSEYQKIYDNWSKTINDKYLKNAKTQYEKGPKQQSFSDWLTDQAVGWQAGLDTILDKSVITDISRNAWNWFAGGLNGLFGTELQKVNPKAKERAKLRDYFHSAGSRHKRLSHIVGLAELGGSIMGSAIDLGILYKLGIGTLTKPAGLTKLAMKIPDMVKSAGVASMFYRAARAGVHATMGGLIGATYEVTKDYLKNVAYDPNYNMKWENAASHFYEYALGDLIVFGIGGLIKNNAAIFKHARKTLKQSPVHLGDDVLKALADAHAGKGIDPNFLARQSKETKRILKHNEAVGYLLNNPSKMTAIDELKVGSGLLGFTTEVDDFGKITLRSGLDSGYYKSFSPNQITKAKQWLVSEVLSSNKTFKPLPRFDNSSVNVRKSRIKLKEVIDVALPEDAQQSSRMLTKLVAPRGGEFKQTNVSLFSKQMGKSMGLDPGDIKAIQAEDNLKVLYNNEELLTIPRFVTTATDELAQPKKIIEAIKSKAPPGVKGSAIQEEFIQSYIQNTQKLTTYSPGWVEQTLKEGESIIQNDKGHYILTLNGEKTKHPSYHSAASEVARRNTTFDTLKTYLYDEGLLLLKVKDGVELRTRPTTPGSKNYQTKKKPRAGLIEKFESVDKLLAEYPGLNPPIDISLGPQIALVNNDVTQGRYFGKVFVGTKQEIYKEFGKFRDLTEEFLRKRIAPNIDINQVTKKFEVHIPDIGLIETFDDIPKAKEFINNLEDPLKKITYGAGRKGYHVSNIGGNWVFYDDQGVKHIGKTYDEAKKLLKSIPAAPDAPELTGFHSKINVRSDLNFNFTPDTLLIKKVPEGKIDGWWLVNNWIRPPDAQFSEAVRQGQDKRIIELYDEFLNARDLLKGKSNEMANIINDVFFSKTLNRHLKKKEILPIDSLRRSNKDKWSSVLEDLKITGEVADGIVEVTERVQKVWDQYYTMAGITAPHQKNYIFRMRDWSYENPKELAKIFDGDSDIFLQNIFGGSPPKELVNTFEFARISELVDFAREKNVKTQLLQYMTMVNKAELLNPPARKIKAWINNPSTKQNFNQNVRRRMAFFLDKAMGIPIAQSEIDLNALSKQIAIKFPGTNVKIARDLASLLIGPAYLSSMGMRPYILARNMLQIFTAGSRIGNKYLFESLNVLGNFSDDEARAFFQQLRAQNTIRSSNIPVGGGVVFQGDDLLTKLSKKLLSHYGSTDDATRALMYKASELRFDEAITKWSKSGKTPKDLERFVKNSGIWNLSDAHQVQVKEFLNRGEVGPAKNLFASDITNETIFRYEPGMSNYVNNGVIGKAFASMGHYSIWWTENLRRILGRGTFSQRMGNAVRLAGNTALVFGALHKVMGINASSFLPWDPVLFGGGPGYDLINNILSAATDPTYQGEIAANRLTGIDIDLDRGLQVTVSPQSVWNSTLARYLTPGSYQIRAIQKGLERLNKGDYYRATLNFFSAPANEDALLPKMFD